MPCGLGVQSFEGTIRREFTCASRRLNVAEYSHGWDGQLKIAARPFRMSCTLWRQIRAGMTTSSYHEISKQLHEDGDVFSKLKHIEILDSCSIDSLVRLDPTVLTVTAGHRTRAGPNSYRHPAPLFRVLSTCRREGSTAFTKDSLC